MIALGQTGMETSRVGLGTWNFADAPYPFGWGPQDDEVSVSTIHHAVELGINWVDTAPVYGRGHAEEVVARALAQLPPADRPYVFTKGGLAWDEADTTVTPWRVGDADRLRREVDSSLRRLQVDQIDLYQMHWPPEDGTAIEEYWGALLDLKSAGKIRAAGLSNHTVAQLETAAGMGHVDSLQPPFSALRRDAAAEIEWCRRHNTGVLVYSPLQSGLLSGTFTAERRSSLPADDWRSDHPDYRPDVLARALPVVDLLGHIADRIGVRTPAVAVAWTLSWPGVTGAIVGARNPGQVDQWVAAATTPLSRTDMDEIAAAIDATDAGSGPARPSVWSAVD